MISIVLPNLQGGGAERVAVHLANYWLVQDLHVEFILMERRGELLDLIDPRIPILDLKALRIRDFILPLRSYFLRRRPSCTLAGLWPLTSAAILAWQLAGRPGSLFVQDHTHLSSACIKELNLSPIYLRCLLRSTYPLATGLMAVSEGVKQDLCRLGGFASDRVQVIYNPVVRGESSPASVEAKPRSEFFGDSFSYHILAVGSFKVQKNFPLLLRAFAKLPVHLNASLVILGDGALRSELEALVHELNVDKRVFLPGFVLDPAPWYRAADLFVLSSSWEGFANVIAEALDFGLPIVSTDCLSGPAEILDNGRYGRLVPVGDVTALAVAMQASLLNSHDHEALRRRAQDFAVSRIADQYLAYFRSMGAQV
jgi:glycosyltransferase involved in cell wall biosynthesis